MEVSGQLHTLAALPQGKSPWYPLDRRLGGPQSRSECGGETRYDRVRGNTEQVRKKSSAVNRLLLVNVTLQQLVKLVQLIRRTLETCT
jgi:hypothetical protein